MKKFFVGQLVRVTNPDCEEIEHLRGAEGRIIEINDDFDDGVVMYGLDIYPITDVGDGWSVGFESYEIDPILPSGHIASTFSFSELMDKCKEGMGA